MKIKGTGVAIVTPFTKTGKVDETSLIQIVEHLIVSKIDFIVVLGTTGEASTLSHEEQVLVRETVVRAANKRVPVVVGIGGNNTNKIAQQINETDLTEISAILSVAPYYNLPNQRGLFEHFSAIAKASPIDIILYNIPSRSGVNIAVETTLALAEEHWNIVAIKEASNNLAQIMKLINNKPEDFSVLSGDDLMTYPIMSVGGDGVISVIANAYPAAFSAMVRLLEKKKFEDALKIHYSLMPIMDAIFADGNPAGIKAAMAKLKMCTANVRLPMVKAKKEIIARLDDLMENYVFPLD